MLFYEPHEPSFPASVGSLEIEQTKRTIRLAKVIYLGLKRLRIISQLI